MSAVLLTETVILEMTMDSNNNYSTSIDIGRLMKCAKEVRYKYEDYPELFLKEFGPEGCYLMGFWYLNSMWGLGMSESRALVYLLAADNHAKQLKDNNPEIEKMIAEARYRIGLCYDHGAGGKDQRDNCFNYYLWSAEAGNYSAMHELAGCYAQGIGVKADEIKFYKWHSDSRASDPFENEFNDEKMPVDEFGNTPFTDYAGPVYWYRDAADRGDADSCFYLGLGYHYGRINKDPHLRCRIDYGTKKDSILSAIYLEEAALRGHEEARKRLKAFGELFVECPETAPEERTAFNAYLNDAQTTHKGYSCYMLGKCYKYGYGTKQDELRAKYWVDMAALNKSSKARRKDYKLPSFYTAGSSWDPWTPVEVYEKCVNEEISPYAKESALMLSFCYEEGLGVQKDLEKAFEFCSKAAFDGLEKAWPRLAAMYRDGRGTGKDPELAELWENMDDAGYGRVLFDQAKKYAEGDGVKQSYWNARQLFTKSHFYTHDPEAYYQIGLSYLKQPDGDESYRYSCAKDNFEKAAKAGHAEAAKALKNLVDSKEYDKAQKVLKEQKKAGRAAAKKAAKERDMTRLGSMSDAELYRDSVISMAAATALSIGMCLTKQDQYAIRLVLCVIYAFIFKNGADLITQNEAVILLVPFLCAAAQFFRFMFLHFAAVIVTVYILSICIRKYTHEKELIKRNGKKY